MTNPSLLADSPLPLSAWAFLLRAFRDTDQPERRRFLVDLFLLVARGLRNASPAADPADPALSLFLWPSLLWRLPARLRWPRSLCAFF